MPREIKVTILELLGYRIGLGSIKRIVRAHSQLQKSVLAETSQNGSVNKVQCSAAARTDLLRV